VLTVLQFIGPALLVFQTLYGDGEGDDISAGGAMDEVKAMARTNSESRKLDVEKKTGWLAKKLLGIRTKWSKRKKGKDGRVDKSEKEKERQRKSINPLPDEGSKEEDILVAAETNQISVGIPSARASETMTVAIGSGQGGCEDEEMQRLQADPVLLPRVPAERLEGAQEVLEGSGGAEGQQEREVGRVDENDKEKERQRKSSNPLPDEGSKEEILVAAETNQISVEIPSARTSETMTAEMGSGQGGCEDEEVQRLQADPVLLQRVPAERLKEAQEVVQGSGGAEGQREREVGRVDENGKEKERQRKSSNPLPDEGSKEEVLIAAETNKISVKIPSARASETMTAAMGSGQGGCEDEEVQRLQADPVLLRRVPTERLEGAQEVVQGSGGAEGQREREVRRVDENDKEKERQRKSSNPLPDEGSKEEILIAAETNKMSVEIPSVRTSETMTVAIGLGQEGCQDEEVQRLQADPVLLPRVPAERLEGAQEVVQERDDAEGRRERELSGK